MADWKKLAKAALLADGRLDTKEVNIIRKELFADGKIDLSEVEFLTSLKKAATSAVKAFDDLYFQAVKQNILADGEIGDNEAKFLRKVILMDDKVDEGEKAFLKSLKAEAKKTSPEFDKLLSEVGVA